MSAPYSMGRSKNGVAKVLSMIRGMLCEWAMAATAWISIRLELGLPKLSMNSALVWGRIAFSKLERSDGSTNVVVMPYGTSVC